MRRSPGTSGGDFDAVVIGSGMGGLTAAALLARLHGQRVLVLERHWCAGGFTHTFSRPGGYHWDVGVHYVGQVERGTAADVLRVMSDGALSWQRMPDPFERLVFPDFEFAIRFGRENFLADLMNAFPAEKQALRRWRSDVERAATYTTILGMRGTAPALVVRAAEAFLAARRRLATTTTGAISRRASEIRSCAESWGRAGPTTGCRQPRAPSSPTPSSLLRRSPQHPHFSRWNLSRPPTRVTPRVPWLQRSPR